ncbi:capsular polysaccharide export protein [Sphingobium faniae]|nr:capsular polysaccharide export protein [Sphingobium faniae]
MILPPFLRSPPFPSTAPDIAAISRPLPADGQRVVVPDAVLDAIAAARVGGDFWGHAVHGVKLVAQAGVPIPPERLGGLEAGQAAIIGGAPSAALACYARKLPQPCDPWALVEQAASVHAHGEDDIALVAGLLGVPVFGPDLQPIDPRHLREAARDRLSQARYRNCFTGEEADVGQAVRQLAEWRALFHANRGISAASGMAWWKRDVMRVFLWDGLRSPPFVNARRGLDQALRQKGALAVWPSRVPPSTADAAAEQGAPLIRIEDGFLRSRGLGAALHPPGSVVADHMGIYYDARVGSDLETILATHDFSTELVERAKRLRERICAAGVTKYGAGQGAMTTLPKGRRTVLAVGQVDDDLSVHLGGAGIAGNLDFLKRVRQAEPDAWIVYRPHPDVQAGHRTGHLSDAMVLEHADSIDSGSPLMQLVRSVDEVHVLSSLTGFEALMRGRSVTVHGLPFYAGWGLTRDLAAPNGRRGRKLGIDQLVAGALILYPRYVDPVTYLPCGPEIMVDRLADGSTPSGNWLIRLRVLQGKLRRLMTLSAELLHGRRPD